MKDSKQDLQAFDERFFERQHAEIMARVEAAKTSRQQRYPLIGLAAGVLLLIGLGAIVLSDGADSSATEEWVFTMPTEDLGQVQDPLAPFGVWDAALEDNSLADLPIPPLEPLEFNGADGDLIFFDDSLELESLG